MKRNFTKIASAFAVAAALVSSCANEELSGYTPDPIPVGEPRFAIATQVTSASTGTTSMYLLTSESLEWGTETVVGRGTELESLATEWSISGENMFSIKDNGGTLNTDVMQYYLDGDRGRVMVKRQLSSSAYHMWGLWGDKFVTTRGGGSSTSKSVTVGEGDSATTYYATEMTTGLVDPTTGVTAYETIDADNFVGVKGEKSTVVGIRTLGDYVYASVATTGVSLYAINSEEFGFDKTNYGKYIPQGWGKYTNMIESTNSFAATSGLASPLTPGTTYIARYGVNDTFQTTPTIITTDKMSQAFGRTTGNPLNTLVANEDDGCLYVFSPGTMRRYSAKGMATSATEHSVTQYETNSTDEDGNYNSSTIDDLVVKTSNLGSSVMRIKSGATEFDSTFGTGGVMTFEDKMVGANGGSHTFSRAWHIAGTKFLLRVIHTENLYNASHKEDVGDAYFYVYDSSTNTATKVTGLPEPEDFVGQGNRAIGEPYFDGSKAYIPMAPNNTSYPAIYVVDASKATPTATRGLEVQCTTIVCVAKLTAQ